MASILYIDPGVCDVQRKGVKLRIDGCACAHFVDGLATSVFFAAECGPQAGAFDLVVIERPHIRGNSTPNPQDIVDLAWDGAALAYSLGAPVSWYLPQQWKGGIPKPAFHRRMWPHLSAAERRLFPAETLDVIKAAAQKGALDKWARSGADYYPKRFRTHNLLDAIGIGLYDLGRYDIRTSVPETTEYERALRGRGVTGPRASDVPGLLHEASEANRRGASGRVPSGTCPPRAGAMQAMLPDRSRKKRVLPPSRLRAR
jgi:hypothetical protein